jgi:hypothetical protein
MTQMAKRVTEALAEGNPGAVTALADVQSAGGDHDWLRIVVQLLLFGPRGSELWERYADRCSRDAFQLKRDILTASQEWCVETQP